MSAVVDNAEHARHAPAVTSTKAVYPRAFASAVRRVLRTSLGRAVGRRMYATGAALAARAFGDLDGVVSVYAGGSFRRLETLSPGYSDVDLLLLTRPFDSVEAHLAFREALDRRMRRVHLAFPALQTLDYLDLTMLPIVRAHGNDFGRSIDARFVRLHGERRLDPAIHATAREPVLDLALALRRWCKACVFILRGEAHLEPFERRRLARKLLTDVVCAYTGLDRLEPFDAIVRATRALSVPPRQREVIDALDDVESLGTDAFVAITLAAALVVLEMLADAQTEDFVGSAVDGDTVAHDPDDVALAERARAAGASDAFVLTNLARSRTRQAFVLFGDDADASTVVARARRFVARTEGDRAHGLHTSFLTPPLVRAASLLDPLPFAGAAFARRARDTTSASVKTSPPHVTHMLVEAMLVRGLWRLPSLRFHERASCDLARGHVERELGALTHLLDVLAGAPLSLDVAPIPLPDERALVVAIDVFRERVRAHFAGA